MAWLKQINDRFYVYYKNDEGKEKSKAIGKLTRKQAERKLIEFEALQDLSELSGPTFIEFSFEYVKWHAFEYPSSHWRVRQILEQYLIPHFGNTRLNELEISEAELYKSKRIQEAAAGTVAKEIRTLKAVLNKAVQWKRCAVNPFQFLKAPKSTEHQAPPYYTKDELSRLYAASYPYQAALWKFLANTGLRRAEICQLLVSDIKDNGFYIVSKKEARTKSGKFRLVPWTEGSREAVKILLDDEREHLIPQLNKRSISRWFDKSAKKAGLNGSMHWLRHTYASHLVMADVPLRAIQQVMGHSTIAVTEKYAHVGDDFIDKRIGDLAI